MSQWSRLTDTQRGYVYITAFVVVGYYLFFSGGGTASGYYYPDYGYHHYGSTGLSWSALALVMFAAYKLPPMFPDILGTFLSFVLIYLLLCILVM